MKAIDLAARCDVSPSAVSRWESAAAAPSHENLERIARACGLDMPTFWALDIEPDVDTSEDEPTPSPRDAMAAGG